MDFENLNELEKIGLAFVSGLIAGQSLEEADEEIEEETKNEKEADVTIEVGKLEGEKAKEFMNFIKKIKEEEK